jgi:hypothetical protein
MLRGLCLHCSRLVLRGQRFVIEIVDIINRGGGLLDVCFVTVLLLGGVTHIC